MLKLATITFVAFAANAIVPLVTASELHDWRRIEADNGAIYAVDLQSIVRMSFGGGSYGAVANICIVDGRQCALSPSNPHTVQFDCKGHYVDVFDGGVLEIAPPKSVIGRIAAIVCDKIGVR